LPRELRVEAVRVMDDIISQRGDRAPGRWPRRPAIIALLVVLAIVALRQLPREGAIPAHRPATVVRAGPVQLAGLGSAVAGLLNQAGGKHLAGDLRRPAVSGRLPGPEGPVRLVA
jgi:hypothetical protein